MFGISKRSNAVDSVDGAVSGFEYLPTDKVYFDAACQSLRPQPVIDAMANYYAKFNSCGERVKYEWGREVDEHVEATRAKVLKMLKLPPKKYFVSFTLNTTYGLNLVLSQLKTDNIKKVITSDIEHNSVFLSTMSLAKRAGVAREVLTRNDDGSIDLKGVDFTGAVVVLNAVSNIDGRQLKNINNVIGEVHRQGGVIVIDAAQAMSFYHSWLANIEADVICFSAHKMYGPSLGVIVAQKALVNKLEPTFLGGGMVDDVERDEFKLSATNDEHVHTIFEPGLQLYGEIIGLGAAIDWLAKAEKNNRMLDYSSQLIEFLRSAGFVVINREATPTICFYHSEFDSDMLTKALSAQDIMARDGYFCAHYYLHHVKDYPHLIRLSLGLHNRQSDIDKFIDTMKGFKK